MWKSYVGLSFHVRVAETRFHVFKNKTEYVSLHDAHIFLGKEFVEHTQVEQLTHENSIARHCLALNMDESMQRQMLFMLTITTYMQKLPNETQLIYESEGQNHVHCFESSTLSFSDVQVSSCVDILKMEFMKSAQGQSHQFFSFSIISRCVESPHREEKPEEGLRYTWWSVVCVDGLWLVVVWSLLVCLVCAMCLSKSWPSGQDIQLHRKTFHHRAGKKWPSPVEENASIYGNILSTNGIVVPIDAALLFANDAIHTISQSFAIPILFSLICIFGID